MTVLSIPLVLASASPRRRAILETLGVPFRVKPSAVEEVPLEDEEAVAHARRIAASKAQQVARELDGEVCVLGADTVVVVDGRILGKPRDPEEAQRMTRMLSGRWHEVVTAVALARGGGRLLGVAHALTRVRFRELSEAQVRGYVASGEGMDKAGAYGVQGLGSGLVCEIAGSYHNVVGLPAVETLELLDAHGVLLEWP